MAKETRGRGGREDAPPSALPQVPPPIYTQPGHDFLLQSVIEMQKSIGELTAKVDRLITDVKTQGDKIDAVRMRMSWIAGGAAVVGALVGIGLAVLRYLPWDKLTGG